MWIKSITDYIYKDYCHRRNHDIIGVFLHTDQMEEGNLLETYRQLQIPPLIYVMRCDNRPKLSSSIFITITGRMTIIYIY